MIFQKKSRYSIKYYTNLKKALSGHKKNEKKIVLIPTVTQNIKSQEKIALELHKKEFKSVGEDLSIYNIQLDIGRQLIYRMSEEEFINLYLKYKTEGGKVSNNVATDHFFEQHSITALRNCIRVSQQVTGGIDVSVLKDLLHNISWLGKETVMTFKRIKAPNEETLKEWANIADWFLFEYYNEKSKTYEYCQDVQFFIYELANLIKCMDTDISAENVFENKSENAVFLIPIYLRECQLQIIIGLIESYIKNISTKIDSDLTERVSICIVGMPFLKLEEVERFLAIVNTNWKYIKNSRLIENQIKEREEEILKEEQLEKERIQEELLKKEQLKNERIQEGKEEIEEIEDDLF